MVTVNLAKVAAFLPDAIGRFKLLIDDLANVTQLQVDRARGLLRVLLGNAIVLHPTADGAISYLTAEVSGDYAGLLRLAVGQNKLGCGEGRPIRVLRVLDSVEWPESVREGGAPDVGVTGGQAFDRVWDGLRNRVLSLWLIRRNSNHGRSIPGRTAEG